MIFYYIEPIEPIEPYNSINLYKICYFYIYLFKRTGSMVLFNKINNLETIYGSIGSKKKLFINEINNL